MRFDLAFDLDAQCFEWSVGGQDVGEIAECILMRIETQIRGYVDPPTDNLLAFVVARCEPQHLDHAGRRRLVAVGGRMSDAQAHIGDG